MVDFNTRKAGFAKTAQEFSSQLMEFSSRLDRTCEKVIRRTCLGVHATAVKTSPVDTGAYCASHSICNEPDYSEDKDVKEESEVTPSGAEAMAKMNVIGWTWSFGDGNIVLFNNQPYAEVLEFGGYPNPPKKGSWVKSGFSRVGKGGKVHKSGGYEIRSSGGFSKQAPRGIYTVALETASLELQQAWEALKGEAED